MDKKNWIILFFIILILFGIGIRLLSLDKDFGAEETDFVKAAEAIKNTGKPVFYHSEQQPIMVALWHPPMYVFLLSIVFRFVTGEIATRSVNVIFSILTSIMIFFFCSKIIKNKRGKIIGIVASTFFLINYYIFSSSILIDIDMLSTFFTFSFLFFLLRNYQTQKNYYLLLSGISLFFSIFNRYPIAFIVYVSIGIYYLINKELRKDFKKYFLVGLSAGVLFILVWGFYSIFIEPGNFLSFIIHNVKFGGEQLSGIVIYFGSFLLNMAQFTRLVTFPSVLLIILCFFYFIKDRSKLTKILLIYSTSILIFFFLIPRPAFGYPRYFLTAFPTISILIGIFLYKTFRGGVIKKSYLITGFLGFFISLIILFVLNPQATIYESDGLIKATNLSDLIFNIFASIPLFFVFLFKKDRKKILIIILLFLILSYSFYFDIKSLNNNSNISEVGDYIKENTNKDELIIVPKAVGYYSKRKFYLNDNNKPKLDFSIANLKKYFKKSLLNREMDDGFFWPGGIYSGLYPPLPPEEVLKQAKYIVLYHKVENFIPEKKIGKFYIYSLQ